MFSPPPDEVKFAKKVLEAIPDGRGVHMIDGKMQDDATWKQCKVMVSLAEMLAKKDPELAKAYELVRFFEYEAREIVKRAGIPVTKYGFAKTADEARRHRRATSAGPTVIKSQVLTGGRMKAGGVKFADTPDEAAGTPRTSSKLEINGHMPRGVLVDPKAELKQEYYAGVVWDGVRKKPVMLFSDMGGIDIEEVNEQHPDRVGRGAPLEPGRGAGLPREGGHRPDRRDRAPADARRRRSWRASRACSASTT